MQSADEGSEQAVAVKAIAELGDALASQKRMIFPICPARGIQAPCDMLIVDLYIALVRSVGEETKQHAVIGHMLERRQLQLVEGDMTGVEVNRCDLRGLSHKIARHIAPARRDGDHMICFVDA